MECGRVVGKRHEWSRKRKEVSPVHRGGYQDQSRPARKNQGLSWAEGRYERLPALAADLGSVLNKDSSAVGVVIQGFRIEGGLDEEATLLAERCRVEAD